MTALKTIIVDDEHHCRENLSQLISEYCPELEVISIAKSVPEARQLIEALKPQVVFLDIKMPGQDGFALLEHFSERDFSIVFTTAHDEFALRALKEGAIDFLEKPINIEELEQCSKKLLQNRAQSHELSADALKELFKLGNMKDLDKTTIPTTDGFIIVNSADIVRLEASESYTRIFLSNEERYMSSKNIKVFERNLNPSIFFRTHKSHIVNMLYHLKGFSRTDGNVALMSSGYRVPISRRKLPIFLQRANA